MTPEPDTLANFIREHPRLVVLTGAGISLDSGIPTYRDDTGKWLPRPPIQERGFLQDANTRRRYWARSWYGWPTIRDAKPNHSHVALAWLEEHGCIELLITQNVDGLHQKAGSHNVIDLHGRVDRVRCLGCEGLHCRNSVQDLLDCHNEWPEQQSANARPDGDMEIFEDLIASIVLPRCPDCGGDLRPDVIFFGGSVPADRVSRCQRALEEADALLVAGSSLMVFSGYRFCRRASQLGIPIAIINPGVTRADELASTRLRCPAGPLLAGAITLLQKDAGFKHSVPTLQPL
jgi:NAD-dependent SIR2 family protein deacetylase